MKGFSFFIFFLFNANGRAFIFILFDCDSQATNVPESKFESVELKNLSLLEIRSQKINKSVLKTQDINVFFAIISSKDFSSDNFTHSGLLFFFFHNEKRNPKDAVHPRTKKVTRRTMKRKLSKISNLILNLNFKMILC